MEEKKKEYQIGMRLKSVQLIAFEITDIGRNLKEQPSFDEYEFSFEVAPVTNIEEETVVMLLKISIFGLKTKEAYGFFTTEFTFEARGIKTIATPQEAGLINVDVNFLRMVAGICVSTARGMLVMALANTKISNALVPIVNPNTFFAEDSAQKFPATHFGIKEK